MIYHFGNATCCKTYARESASQGFHDGVGQIVRHRGDDKEVGSIVGLHDAFHFFGISHWKNWDIKRRDVLFGCPTEDEQGSVVAIVGMRCQEFLERLDEVRTTFAHIRDLLCHEKHDFQIRISGKS